MTGRVPPSLSMRLSLKVTAWKLAHSYPGDWNNAPNLHFRGSCITYATDRLSDRDAEERLVDEVIYRHQLAIYIDYIVQPASPATSQGNVGVAPPSAGARSDGYLTMERSLQGNVGSGLTMEGDPEARARIRQAVPLPDGMYLPISLGSTRSYSTD